MEIVLLYLEHYSIFISVRGCKKNPCILLVKWFSSRRKNRKFGQVETVQLYFKIAKSGQRKVEGKT